MGVSVARWVERRSLLGKAFGSRSLREATMGEWEDGPVAVNVKGGGAE